MLIERAERTSIVQDLGKEQKTFGIYSRPLPSFATSANPPLLFFCCMSSLNLESTAFRGPLPHSQGYRYFISIFFVIAGASWQRRFSIRELRH